MTKRNQSLLKAIEKKKESIISLEAEYVFHFLEIHLEERKMPRQNMIAIPKISVKKITKLPRLHKNVQAQQEGARLKQISLKSELLCIRANLID